MVKGFITWTSESNLVSEEVVLQEKWSYRRSGLTGGAVFHQVCRQQGFIALRNDASFLSFEVRNLY